MFLEPLRMFFLTRPLTLVATAAFRLSPLLALLAWSAVAGVSPTAALWFEAGVSTAVLVTLMFVVEHRCSTPDRSFHGGLLVIAASVSSGWMFFDVLFVLGALWLAQSLACLLALSRDPPERFHEMVGTFYRHRMLH